MDLAGQSVNFLRRNSGAKCGPVFPRNVCCTARTKRLKNSTSRSGSNTGPSSSSDRSSSPDAPVSELNPNLITARDASASNKRGGSWRHSRGGIGLRGSFLSAQVPKPARSSVLCNRHHSRTRLRARLGKFGAVTKPLSSFNGNFEFAVFSMEMRRFMITIIHERWKFQETCLSPAFVPSSRVA